MTNGDKFMKLSEFFDKAKSKNIVINTDIDGFLSGMVLQKYMGCKIVGFTNSEESIWLTPDIKSIYDPKYVDIFINKPETYCIDQHIVAYNNHHLGKIMSYGTKLNPNLDIEKRIFCNDLGPDSNYYHKYPFAKTLNIMALIFTFNIR